MQRALALGCLVTSGAIAANSTERPEAVQTPAHARTASALVGVVFASRALDIVPLVEGRLDEVKTRVGEQVAAGQVLAVVDPRPLKLEASSLQANLQAAEAEQGRAMVLLTQARQRLEREKQISVYVAAESLETAEHQVSLATSDVKLAQARVAQARAQLALANSNLENAQLLAPFGGVIAEQFAPPGKLVGRTTPILRLVSDDRRLRFAVPETLATSVRLGDRVKARVTTSGIVLQGVVDTVSPEIEAASRHRKVEAQLELPSASKGALPTGLLVQVELQPALSASEASSP